MTGGPTFAGSHSIVVGGVIGIAGSALLALAFGVPWLALGIVTSALLGGLVGLHVQAIREAESQKQQLRRLNRGR